MSGKLTDKQERFVAEMQVDMNATAAYKRAGYKVKNDNVAAVEAQRLLRNPKIAAAVARTQSARSKRTELSADKVLREISHVAFARMTSFMTWGLAPETGADGKIVKDEQGRPVISPFAHWTPSAQLTPEQAAAIAEVHYDDKTGKLKIKLHSKTHALEQLGRHLGLFEKDPTKLLEALLAGFDPQFAAGVREGIRQEVSAGS